MTTVRVVRNRGNTAAGGSAISHGDTFSITGSGFGTKASAPPVLFDTFASGTLGASVNGAAATIGQWTNDPDVSANPTYSDAFARGVYTRSSNHRYSRSPELYNVGLYKTFPAGTVRLYLDWWIYMTRDVFGERSRNHKIFRAYPAEGDEAAGYDDFFYHTTVCRELGTGGGAFGECGNNYSDLGPDSIGLEFVQLPFDNWCHIQTAGFVNAAGGWFWVQDHLQYLLRSGVNTTDGSRELRRVRMNHYLGTEQEDACPQTVGFDIYGSCMYLDTTLMRVECGNNSVYANCTIREPQPCTGWANTEIEATFNQGLLESGTNYRFVFDNSMTLTPIYSESFEVAP